MPSSLPTRRRRVFPLAVEQLEARCLLAPVWKVSFDEPGSAHAEYYSAIRSTLLAAGQEWNRYLPAGQGSIEVSVKFRDLENDWLATAGSETSVFFEKRGALETWEPSAASEIRTGKDPNGKSPDAVVTLDKTWLRQTFWFDPTPGNPFDETVPSDKHDAFSLFLHELGHVLGFDGYRDWITGKLTGNVQYPFDRFVTMSGGVAYFNGPSAQAAYANQPVPLYDDNVFHVGRQSGELSYDVMSGDGMPYGQRQSISTLDASILKDLGLPVSLQPVNTPPYLSTIDNQTLAEDESRDVALAVGDLDTIIESLDVTITSSNPALFPASGLQLFRYQHPRYLTLRPAAEASGSATITISASDGSLTTVQSFQVTVTPYHDPPEVRLSSPQSMSEDQILDVYVGVDSVEVPASSLILTVRSNPASLFGPDGISITNQGDLRVVRLAPAKDQNTRFSGYALLNFTVSDGVRSSSDTLRLEVSNTPDVASITPIDDQYLVTNEDRQLTFHATDDLPSEPDWLHAWVESSNPAVVTAFMPGIPGSRELQLVTQSGASGFAKITLYVRNYAGDATEVFHVRVADNPFPWRNAVQAFDVDGNGIIMPLDAVLIINYLNVYGAGPLGWPSAEYTPTRFYDVDPDNRVLPVDAVLVINYLNQQSLTAAQAASAEGEYAALAPRIPAALPPTPPLTAAIDLLLPTDSYTDLLTTRRQRKR